MIGWIGAFLLAMCGLPQAIEAVSTLNCTLTWAFLLMWFFGEVFTLIYVVKKSKEVKLLPLLFNYGMNILFILVMITIKVLA